MRQVFVAALVGLALVLASGPALACGTGPPPSTNAIEPVRPTLVTLETMEVRFRVFLDHSEVEAVFTLTNTGPATTVVMGLPEGAKYAEEPYPFVHDLRAFVDGLEVPVRRDPDLVSELLQGYPVAWHVWEVSFAAGQTRQVRYTCWSDMGFTEDVGPEASCYLEPARRWHGSIGRVRIVFELVSYSPYHVYYDIQDPSYRFEGDNVVWEYHDFEVRFVFVRLSCYADRFLKSVHDKEPGRPTFQLATKWEELSRAGSYAELLAEVEAHRRDEGMKVNPFLAPLYEARALNGLGRTQDAVRNWHSILELKLLWPDDDEWRLHPAQYEAFYHLVRHYHAAGDRDRVVELYERLKRRRPTHRPGSSSLELQRWMESLLPPELTGGEPPTVEAFLVPREPPSYNNGFRSYSLRYHARDPDGDLISVEWATWHAGDDPEHTTNQGGLPLPPSHEWDHSKHIWVRPHERVWYRVEAVDLKGNRGSTGILEYVPPDDAPPATSAPPGYEPATPAALGDEPVAPAGPGDEPVAPDPPRRSAWRLVGWGMLAAALVMAWRRRRARSLRAGPGA